ncbi:MAG: hypothetical protein FJY37_18025 [Betaproteobacteria bacterium]|nr:hypothetical protein [Betaproteobacteria bacterium]
MKKLLAAPFILLSILNTSAYADEEAQIVTTCHYANAEWGYDMMQLCITENRALRDEVLRLGPEHAGAVERCRKQAEFGWAWVKQCVLKRTSSTSPASPEQAE